MTLFWLSAAVLIAVALLFLLPPLLRGSGRSTMTSARANLEVLRDQLRELDGDLSRGTISAQQYAQAKLELEHRLIDEVGPDTDSEHAKTAPAKRVIAIALVLLVPLSAAAIYWVLGNPAALIPENRLGMSEADLAERQKVLGLTRKLAEKMRERPDDPVGWAMLGRAYKLTEQFDESVKAFERSIKLDPNNVEVLTEFAEAKMLALGGQLGLEGEAALQQALRLDSKNQRALALAGTAAYEAKKFRDAIEYWERLAQLVPADSDFAKNIAAGIAQARVEMAQTRAQTGASGALEAATPEAITGEIALAKALRGKANPDDTVFVFARAAQGPRMPLAILRTQVKHLPLNFSLDDSMAMSPQAKISGASEIVAGARISRSGNPMPQPGDLEGLSAVIKPGTKNVVIVIDKVIQ